MSKTSVENQFKFGNIVESELARLIRVANDGRRAMDKLVIVHLEQIEYWDNERFETTATISTAKGVKGPVRHVIGCELRIKPARPTFPEIYVGPLEPGGRYGQWHVKISDDGETVNLGCKAYPREAFTNSLGALCKPACHSGDRHTDQYTLLASRHGISDEGYIISWDDADQLLKALEDYQGQLKAK